MSVDEIIAGLRTQAQESWTGVVGEERADELEQFIRSVLVDYSAVLGLSQEHILSCIEEKRDYIAVNYYQRANFPLIGDIDVYNSAIALQVRFPSGKFVCPNCGKLSTHPTTCNSGHIMENGKPCDWKAWGLFHTLGKGYRFVIKDDFLSDPVVHEIFMPLELSEEPGESP